MKMTRMGWIAVSLLSTVTALASGREAGNGGPPPGPNLKSRMQIEAIFTDIRDPQEAIRSIVWQGDDDYLVSTQAGNCVQDRLYRVRCEAIPNGPVGNCEFAARVLEKRSSPGCA